MLNAKKPTHGFSFPHPTTNLWEGRRWRYVTRHRDATASTDCMKPQDKPPRFLNTWTAKNKSTDDGERLFRGLKHTSTSGHTWV